MIDNLVQDLRYALRALIKRKAFAGVVILTLALGIGASTAIFCVVNAVLIRPLPFKAPDRLVMIWESNKQKGISQDHVSPADLTAWRDQSVAFEAIEAFDSSLFVLTGVEEPERISGSRVSTGLLPMLGVSPMKGRSFLSEEGQPGRDQVVVVSHELWQRRFGSDPELIGKVIRLDNKDYEVIGIMPAGFDFPKWLEPAGARSVAKSELWTPLALSSEELGLRGARFLKVVARLNRGVTPEQAQVALAPIAQELEQKFQENQGYTVAVVPMREQVVGRVRTALLVFFGAISFVLLITCANVASLLLARATSRRKEIAIRMALGCGRRRLMQQLLTESVLLALIGGLGGLLLALWGIRLLVSGFPEIIPRSGEIGIDASVFGFSLVISLATGLLFGIIPALQASKADLNDSLKEGGRSSAGSLSQRRTRSILVLSEVALALVLLIGAGLLIRSFVRLTSVPPGFNQENLLALRIALPSSKYNLPQQKIAFFQQLMSRVENLQGVRSVAMTTNLPLSGTNMSFRFMVEGRAAPPTEILLAQYHAVSPNYFQTMGIPLLQGRDFTEHDIDESPPVVIINETLARRFFADEDPIGKRLKITYGKPAPRQIIGVIKDVKHKGLESGAQEELYVPYNQNPWAFTTLVARTDADPNSIAADLRGQVQALDKDQPIDSIKTVEQLLADSVSRPRFYANLLGLFSALAMMLAAVGIYGLISYTVTQRTHEIGVRIALGAQQRDVVLSVVSQGLALALCGVLSGLVASFVLTRFMSSLLFGVGVTDPLTFVAVSLLLIGVALMASYIPARRAARVDPMIALRHE